jgi:uncharacterized protein
MNDHPPRKLPVVGPPGRRVEWFSTVVLAMMTGYRAFISPILLSIGGPACRFEPTCSAYATQAILRYGVAGGGWMALKRLMKCRPLGGWGFDPVPATRLASRVNIGRHRSLSR